MIFKSQRTPQASIDGYDETAKEMLELAKTEPGFLGIDSVRGADGTGLSVSYWRSREDIKRWKLNARHALARKMGREKWYASFTVHIARIEEPTKET